MRLRITLKNLNTDCDFTITGVEWIKQNKDWIEVKYNIQENKFFEQYLYERTQYDLVSIEPYKE